MDSNKYCKYCGGRNEAIKDRQRYGNHIALVCSECHKWQKWLSKREYDTFPEICDYMFDAKAMFEPETKQTASNLPFDIEPVTPCSDDDTAIKELRAKFYESIGISEELFASGGSGESLKIINDNLIKMFNDAPHRVSVPKEKEGLLIESQRFYGENFEKNIAIEELSELIKEIAKDFRGLCDSEHIAEEMADVYIMLRHLEIIYKNSSRVQYYIDEKLKRLDERMKNEKKAMINTSWHKEGDKDV